MSGLSFYLIAGEASGDKLGAALMQGLKALHQDVTFHGVGGPLMEAEGLTSLFDMTELSIMGIAEVAPKYFHLKRRIKEVAQDALTKSPNALITIDSPDFCLRVASLVKAENPNLKTIHYVAPSVWAWRENRADKMAKVIDHVLALLPFEPPYMERAGMSCDFVGHPVVAEKTATDTEVQNFRAHHEILEHETVVLALPGSRKGEVRRLAPRFGAALTQVAQDTPIRVVVPTVVNTHSLVEELTSSWGCDPILVPSLNKSAKAAAFGAADFALAASGTVSLELAANAVPMVIAYDMNWLSRIIISRALRIDTVTLVNLVSETRVVPEFLGPACTSDAIYAAMHSLMEDPSQQKEAMQLTMDRLGQGGEAPGLRAARSVLAQVATS
ncbi:MAG: lipid-A-disaccharide synthase [Halocynthiibacter sp.]